MPGAEIDILAGGYRRVEVTCPAGKRVLGGGGANTATGGVIMTDSYPPLDTMWRVYFKNNDGITHRIAAWAVCATVA
ncbi:MAG: hypothetical protein ACRDJM_09130 [Actinomycetota bacterium]